MSNLTPNTKVAGFQEEIQFEALRRLHQTPQASQRALSKHLNVGLGTINFCLEAQVEKGWGKIQNFSQSKNKLRCVYLPTPDRIAEKSMLTLNFLSERSRIMRRFMLCSILSKSGLAFEACAKEGH